MESITIKNNTLKNIVYSFFGYAWPVLFSIFITPVVVHRLGVTDYGVFILINTITAFLSLIDLGLNIALIKFVSEYFARHDFDSMQKLLNSARSLYVIVGVLGLIVFAVVGSFASFFFNIPADTRSLVLPVFILAGAVFLLTSFTQVYTVVPIANQRYDISTKLNTAQLTMINLTMLVLVIFGFGLKAIFVSNLVWAVIQLFAYRSYAHKLLPALKFGFGWSVSEIKKAYTFGILAAVTNLASNSLIQMDRFIIPIFTGPGPLTYYSLPGNVAQKTYGIVGSLSSVFFPLTSSLAATGNVEKIREIYKRSFRNFTLIAAGITAGIMVFAYKILFFWLGRDFAERGESILLILAATYLILAIYGPLTNILMGMGQVKFLMYFSVLMAVLNVALLVIFVPRFGILGAAWAYLFALLPVPFAFYWTEKKVLFLDGMVKYYSKLYGKIIITFIMFYIITHYAILPWINNLYLLVVSGPASVLMFYLIYKLSGFFEPEDEELINYLIGKFKNKISGVVQ